MAHSPTFDFDKACELLESAANALNSRPDEHRAITFAAIALHFVRDLGKFDEFREYAWRFNADMDRPPDRVFQNMDEAERWLLSASPGCTGMLLEVAGARFMVVPGQHAAPGLLPVSFQDSGKRDDQG